MPATASTGSTDLLTGLAFLRIFEVAGGRVDLGIIAPVDPVAEVIVSQLFGVLHSCILHRAARPTRGPSRSMNGPAAARRLDASERRLASDQTASSAGDKLITRSTC